jgi:hypothetical protein
MNLRELAVAVKALKVATGNATDGLIIGVDTLSGGPYTGDLPAVGSILKMAGGKTKVVVDAIAYGDHNNDGNFYPGTNRLVLVEFDPETLEITGDRTNAAFKSINKAQNLGMIFDYVVAREEEIFAASEAAQAAADKARRNAEAAATKANMASF